jgi:hypothetical protein
MAIFSINFNPITGNPELIRALLIERVKSASLEFGIG